MPATQMNAYIYEIEPQCRRSKETTVLQRTFCTHCCQYLYQVAVTMVKKKDEENGKLMRNWK